MDKVLTNVKKIYSFGLSIWTSGKLCSDLYCFFKKTI